ncbi:uncharacterized protein [Primulina huaijiensis]|uniref:uncharacterized protein n=1 Tax=Primulina huaijiensis TaxID=1492673 RepID=UPI003CC789FD
MAPGGRGRKEKEIAQESEAQNVRGLADIIRGRRGRPRGQVAQNVEEEVNQESSRPERPGARQVAIEQEMEQLTQKVGGMQLIISQFQELRPQKFFGNESGEKAAGWLKSINHLFNLLEYSQDIRLKLAIYQLKDRAQLWWEATEEAMKDSGDIITWDAFRAHFSQEYAPPSYYAAKEEEFNQLVQGNKSVVEYTSQFSALLPYVPHVARNDQAKLSRFLHGLQRTVHTLVMTGSPNTYIQAVEKAKKIEASLLRGEPQPGPSSVSQGSGSSVSMPVDLPPYHPVQSYQQPKQQRYKAKGKQFKKKSQSSSSSSGIFRPYAPTLSFQQSRYPPPRGPIQQPFPGPQQAQVHALTQDQAQDVPGGVIADTGASHSFLSAAFVDKHEIATIPLLDTVSVATPAGVYLMSREIVLNCVLRFEVSAMEMFRLLSIGNEGFLIYALDATREERLKVSDIPVVKDFPDVFPNEIPGFPPQKEIDLSIELMPGTNPISRASYRLAPTELKELKEQLHDLLEKGYIRPSHVISAQGVSVDPSKVEAVINWPKPTNVSKIRSFLGLAGYYRRFIEGFSKIARPMTQLTQKDRRFVWTAECASSFRTLKEKLTTAPVLALPSGSGGFFVCTDASLNGLGCVLMQHGRYQPGTMNQVADALSRKVQPKMLTSLTISKVHEHLGTSGWTYRSKGDYFIVSSIQVEPQIVSKIKAAQRTDPHVHKLKELTMTGQSDKFSVASDRCLRYNGRLVVPNLIDLKESILREAHCSRHSVHPGIRKMYHILKSHYWWEGMKKEISEFVAKCLTCQQVKAERMRPGGMLHSLEVPQWNWEHIAMDFVTHLPRSNRGCDAIWVIVDRLSKSAHFIPYDRTCTYKKMAKMYIDHIVCFEVLGQFAISIGFKVGNEHCISPTDRCFQATIGMAPFEALYGRKCRSPICWEDVGERQMSMPEFIQEMKEKEHGPPHIVYTTPPVVSSFPSYEYGYHTPFAGSFTQFLQSDFRPFMNEGHPILNKSPIPFQEYSETEGYEVGGNIT